jgi:hypothetical protein
MVLDEIQDALGVPRSHRPMLADRFERNAVGRYSPKSMLFFVGAKDEVLESDE